MCEKCRTEESATRVPRPVRLADFMLIAAGFVHHVALAFEIAMDSILQVAQYHAERKQDESKAWEEFANDLEKLQEDTDGAS